MGYWNDPAKTAERFKPVPGQDGLLTKPEIAVWSGDTVKKDRDGYLYFVGRNDDMIKTSGYRVSPTEVEEEIYASELVGEVVCLGLPHTDLGQAILAIATPRLSGIVDGERVIKYCKTALPSFMVPLRVEWCDDMPRNPNGKIDRQQLRLQYQNVFS
jgi:acyl-coenzyme A synthetase/AMP-(fatty) acid ligase